MRDRDAHRVAAPLISDLPCTGRAAAGCNVFWLTQSQDISDYRPLFKGSSWDLVGSEASREAIG